MAVANPRDGPISNSIFTRKIVKAFEYRKENSNDRSRTN